MAQSTVFILLCLIIICYSAQNRITKEFYGNLYNNEKINFGQFPGNAIVRVTVYAYCNVDDKYKNDTFVTFQYPIGECDGYPNKEILSCAAPNRLSEEYGNNVRHIPYTVKVIKISNTSSHSWGYFITSAEIQCNNNNVYQRISRTDYELGEFKTFNISVYKSKGFADKIYYKTTIDIQYIFIFENN